MKHLSDKIFVFVSSVERFKGNRKLPEFAEKEIENTSNQKVLDEKYAAFGLLDWALKFLKIDDNFENIVKINGKPHSPFFQFSFSHSHGLVAMAICKKDIGIDVEQVDKNRNLDKIKRYVCSLDEMKYAKNMKRLTKLWTKKESAFKLHGGAHFVPKAICENWCKTKKIKFENKIFFLSVCADEKRKTKFKMLF